MTIMLKPVDSVEITILVDNYTDLLLAQNTPTVQRPLLDYGKTLIAEHGLSLLIRVRSGVRTCQFLMDAGSTDHALFENAKMIGIDLEGVEEIVVSHGHYDHIGGLDRLLRSSSCRMPVHLHPAAFARRRKIRPDGSYLDLPVPVRDEISHAGGILHLSKDPSLICQQMVMITGEVERTTDFEQGSPVLEAEGKDGFVRDMFRDDQAVVLHLKDKGLIVISGCAHAGIVNTVRYAGEVTGVDSVHAVLGGFHLSGPHFETIIPDTVRSLGEIDPDWIIPMHCTGFTAQVAFREAMPDKFVISTVGTTFRFE